MGCEFCTSGLGDECRGPLGIDGLEVGCDCDCHRCYACDSPYCETVGGDEECEDYYAWEDD